MDGKILGRIRENEHTYHAAVMKYLKDKELELRSVLKRMDDKNSMADGKDFLIGKMKTLVNKIEADGSAILGRLRLKEESSKEIKEAMQEMTRDHSFLTDKVRKEKRNCRQQENLILTLKEKNERLEVAVTAKDQEIRDLELKLLRQNNLVNSHSVTKFDGRESSKDGATEEADDVVLDGVMITQRGQKVAENKDSVYCPFT